MEASNVFVYKLNNPSYPKIPPFHPDKLHPEYRFVETSNEVNYVYNSFRELLYLMGLDKENYNTKNWNPFKNFISPGNLVVIKPNLVLNNPQKQNSLTTHASLIRVIIDFVIIALKRKGEIIIGDAPLQRCDFNELIENSGLRKTIDFYKAKKINIKLVDFRKEMMVVKRNRISNSYKKYKITKLKGDPKGYKIVNLKEQSNLYKISLDDNYKKFRVTNYDPKIMRKAHNHTDHRYFVSNSVLQADTIINISKLKAHRKAGFTGCLKNCIGINGNKDWLPHHRVGAISEGGDEYLEKNYLKKFYEKLINFEDILLIKYPKIHNFLYYLFFFFRAGFLRVLSKIKKNNFLEGSWYGNNTLWRTIADLNQILIYTDKKGKITNTSQRKRFYICDGIISGQSEGPLEPIPVKTGIIAGGYDPLMIDLSLAELMDLNYKKIPQLDRIFKLKKNKISEYNPSDLLIFSNNSNWNIKKLNELTETLNFIPSSGWKKIIKKSNAISSD